MLDHHLLEPARNIVRNHLAEYTKKPLYIGNNFIDVHKVLEKWVIMSESRNDLVQSSKRIPLKDAIIYFEYKKHLLAINSSSDDLIDPTNQNKQYQTQYENYNETFIDVQNALTIIWKKHTSHFSFDLKDDQLIIDFPGYKVKITLSEEGDITLNTDFVINNIDNKMSYTFLNCFSETSDLIFEGSKKSFCFNIDFNRLIVFKKQLKMLVTFVNENQSSEDLEISNKIKNFINAPKKGYCVLEIPYDSIEVNGSIFERTFRIIKLTKIRTVVDVIAKSGDIELSEYEKTYTKVSHQIDFHTNEMTKLYLANK